MRWRAILASPLGFLIGLSLGALGGGGSILAVPVLVHAAGQDPRDATASSLLLVGIAAVVGLVPHLRAGRVRVVTGFGFGAAGIGGSLAGTALNRRIDPDHLLVAFSALTIVAAWRMLTACPTCTQVGEDRAIQAGDVLVRARVGVSVGRLAGVLAAGTTVGFLTGLFGVGGGFVIVPALTLLLHLSIPVAIGTSLLVIAINALAALGGRAATSSIDWGVTLPFAAAAIGGVLSGGQVARRLDPVRTLRWFAALLVAVALYTTGTVLV